MSEVGATSIESFSWDVQDMRDGAVHCIDVVSQNTRCVLAYVVSGPKGSLVTMLSSLPQCEAVVDHDGVLKKQGLRQIESLAFDKE